MSRAVRAPRLSISRRESFFVIPTDPEVTGLHDTDEPDGVVIISANDGFEDQLRLLDDALRQDVPGTEGWQWDPAGFNEETFGSDFDPATYLVAVDVASGEYIGLVRVWNSPGRPRLGLIAVLPPYRRRGLATVLLARAFRALHERGKKEVTAEVDDTNAAGGAIMSKLRRRRRRRNRRSHPASYPRPLTGQRALGVVASPADRSDEDAGRHPLEDAVCASSHACTTARAREPRAGPAAARRVAAGRPHP